MNESKLQKQIRDALMKWENLYCVKMHGGPHQARGLPDIVGVVEGIFFGIEVKMPGKEKTLTPIQKKKLNDIANAGGIAIIATSVEQAETRLRKRLDDGY